jgi:hypothetical protein
LPGEEKSWGAKSSDALRPRGRGHLYNSGQIPGAIMARCNIFNNFQAIIARQYDKKYLYIEWLPDCSVAADSV